MLLLVLVGLVAGCTRPAPPVVQTRTTTMTVAQPQLESHAMMVEPQQAAAGGAAPTVVVRRPAAAVPPIRVVEVDPPAAAAPPPPVAAPAAPTTPGVLVQLSVSSPTPTPVPSPTPLPAPSQLVFPPETMQDVPLPTDDLPFASPRPNAPTRSDPVDRTGLPTDALPGGSP